MNMEATGSYEKKKKWKPKSSVFNWPNPKECLCNLGQILMIKILSMALDKLFQ